MKKKEELRVLDGFIKSKRLRQTSQRETILSVFLSTEKHVSCLHLHRLVKKKDPSIGYTTVYRTMKLLSVSGLCGRIDLGDGVARFEHKYGHSHHDHLICTKCGKLIEAMHSEIEKLQFALAQKHGFQVSSHRLEIFGVCKTCVSSRKK